jgi:hypothetical protein
LIPYAAVGRILTVSAKRITAVRTRRVKGKEEVTHLGEAHRSSMRWLTVREVIRSIEAGEHFYIEAGSESLLLSVQKGSDDRKVLAVGFEPSAELLLTLPRDPG